MSSKDDKAPEIPVTLVDTNTNTKYKRVQFYGKVNIKPKF